MKIFNVIWGFSTGGIGKLFLSYSTLGQYDEDLNVYSVCIDLQNCTYDRQALYKYGIEIISIRNRSDFSWLLSLSKLADKVKPDVIFCHGFNGPIVIKLASLICKNLRMPMVCTYHGLYNPPIFSRRLIANFLNLTQAWIYKKYAKKVIIVSKYSGEYLLNKGVPASKLVVIYNGIPKEHSDVTLQDFPPNTIKIGMVGRLDAIKGLSYLIEAIPLMVNKVHDNFHLYVVGDGPAKYSLINQAYLLGVNEYVSFVGYQDNVSDWLNTFDIFCLPSLQENHSIALLEAMRAKKAIVCTSVGGNTETVTNGKEAFVVQAKNAKALAEALGKLIDSSQLRLTLGENAYKRFSSHYTEEIMKIELCKALKSATL